MERSNYCVHCGTPMGEGFFCVNCGAKVHITGSDLPYPNVDDEEAVITHYFKRGFPYTAIVVMLRVHHGITMSERTLRRRLHQYGLSRKMASNISPPQLEEIIRREIQGPSACKGYRGVWMALKTSYGIIVPRKDVMLMVRTVDPEGTDSRRARSLRRRHYRSEGPNKCWHVDGYDKLKPYGLPIHGCIDGYSRKIIWLKVARSNNDPLIPAAFYINAINSFGHIPTNIRTDCGTENGIMAAAQCFLSEDENAHKYGSSHHNQRIEGWWSFYKKSFSTWVIDLFKDLMDRNMLSLGHVVHLELIWFVFSALLQQEMDAVKYQWNSHYIRRSRHDTVPGVPDVLYFAPELTGGVDKKITLSHERVLQLIDQRNILEDAEPVLTERNDELNSYFQYLVGYYALSYPPLSWADARSMYEQLVQSCV